MQHRARLCIALLIASLLSACQKPVPEDVVGTWQASSAETATTSAYCVTITFEADGQFQTHGYPSDFFGEGIQESFPASGEWQLDTASNDPFAIHRIGLVFRPSEAFPAGFNSELGITVDHGALFHGADTTEVFHRTDEPTCP